MRSIRVNLLLMYIMYIVHITMIHLRQGIEARDRRAGHRAIDEWR